MYWDVVEVRAEPEWTLAIRFADGSAGRIRFAPGFFTGVFEPLLEPALFSQVYIDQGNVAWPGEIDLAPDALYEQIRAPTPLERTLA